MQQNNQWFYWNNLPSDIPENISSLNDEQKNEFLKKWDEAIWTKNTQNSDQRLSNIKSLVAIKIAVPEWVMDRLKESADHYVNGSWLSAIALSESICEFLTYYFLENYYCFNLFGQGVKLETVTQMGTLEDAFTEDDLETARQKLPKVDFIPEDEHSRVVSITADDYRKINDIFVQIDTGIYQPPNPDL